MPSLIGDRPLTSVEKTRRWRRKYPDRLAVSQRRAKLKRYGLTEATFLNMLALQNNCCAICHVGFVNNEIPHVDHNHENGSVRGLLCGPCNRGIGLMRDNPENLINAAAYLMERN